MNPIQEVENVLSSNEKLKDYVNENQIYLIYIPQNDQSIENAPLIRINELESYRSDYRDDKASSITVDIQIDTWAKTLKETQEIQMIIDDAMANANYKQYASDLTKDPDIELYKYSRRYRATKKIQIN
ncbi:hypothetical protein [Bacillus safensis]|uniref:hypothetical protein n=1 Tax=Bacillus safensis TaxID=561879 RepID=UPI0032E7F8D4